MTKLYPYHDEARMELEGKMEQDIRTLLPLALADANDIRRALAIGDGVLEELPKGTVGNSHDCVLARALSNGWSAEVDGDESMIRHPVEGKTREDILKSVGALDQLGFDGVSWQGPGGGCSCGDPDCDAPSFETEWMIKIPHTWPMAQFITAFDQQKFPELILDAT